MSKYAKQHREYQSIYRAEHKEILAEKAKEYRAENAEKIKAYKSIYRAEKIECSCGSIVNRSSYAKHLKGLIHLSNGEMIAGTTQGKITDFLAEF
jgi:hypothetical protein